MTNKIALLVVLLHLTGAGVLAAKPERALPRYVAFSNAPISAADLQKFEGQWGGLDADDPDRSSFDLRPVRAGVMEMRSQGGEPDASFGAGPVYLTWHGGDAYMSTNWIDWTWKPKPPLPREFIRRACYAVSRIRILPGGDLQTELIDEARTIKGNPTIAFGFARQGRKCVSEILAGLSAQDRDRIVLIPSEQTADNPPNILRRIGAARHRK